MYKPLEPIIKGIAAISLAGTLYAGKAAADEPAPYALSSGGAERPVPTLVERLRAQVREYCSRHKDEPICSTEFPRSPFEEVKPEELLGQNPAE